VDISQWLPALLGTPVKSGNAKLWPRTKALDIERDPLDALADDLAGGQFRAQDVRRFAALIEKTETALKRAGDDADRLTAELHERLAAS
jgi:hypothetical protein